MSLGNAMSHSMSHSAIHSRKPKPPLGQGHAPVHEFQPSREAAPGQRPALVNTPGHAPVHSSPHPSPYPSAYSSGQALQRPVLVLNASYEPINICGARRALILVLKGIAKTEEEHGAILHAARMRIPMPSVIRLLEYRRIPHQTRALSRKNILLRDRNSCQYCGLVLPAGELTLDHVVPRSRGGLSTWENLVACCHSCNRKKGDSLIGELNHMKLLREPRSFSLHTSRHIMRMIGHSDQKWRKYLYY